MKADLVIKNASELITCSGEGLGIINNGWLAACEGRIVAVGDERQVRPFMNEEAQSKVVVVDASGKTVAPGFVDCHTHLVFGGDRLEEDALRLAGESPASMKAKGTDCLGMNCSVRRTREAGADGLFRQAAARLERMIANGATTIECKSGYGLCLETELLQLETVERLAQAYRVDLIPTFLGAHSWPDDMSKDVYLDLVIKDMLPAVAERGLAVFCDIWVDEGVFTAADAERLLTAGLDYGLTPKIHAEAYSFIGASDVAAELEAASSDHLNYTPPETLRRLAAAGVVGVLAPCTDYVVRHPRRADAGLMMDNGLDVAVATNCNPGCWCTNMPFALQIAARLNGMSIAEALRGATVNGAKALKLYDRGMLTVNCLADFQIWCTDRHENFFYRLGEDVIEAVYKRGRKIA